jgi:hypothetical protein
MRVHVQSKKTHWAIQAPKVICPICKSGYGHKCIATRNPFMLLPGHTVHVERVQEAGYNVRV